MFDLRILANVASLEAIKEDFRASLPDIKSSHRVEAAARGLGFTTHAAWLAAARTGSVLSGPVHGAPFGRYLADHGITADPRHLYRAAARVAIRAVMSLEPKLTHWGYGVGQPKRHSSGQRESRTELHARFQEEREQLLANDAVEQFLRSLVLVQQFKPIKTINNWSGSYGLKHQAERIACTYPDGARLGPHYVANGSLIVAAVHAGFKYKTYLDDSGYEDVNVSFNMSRVSIDDALHRFGQLDHNDDRARRAARRMQRRSQRQGLL